MEVVGCFCVHPCLVEGHKVWNAGKSPLRDQRFGVFDRIATMRFKKGSVVEVLSRKEVASGSWFRAEIVSGNGHYYNVKYDNCLPDGGCVMGKVQRKDIRPCPPEMAGSMGWVPGDVVEVLENNSWKAAKMVKSLDGGNCYVVTPVGSTGELMLHKSNVRLRQFWKGDRWVLFDMEAENLNQGKLEMPFEGGKVNHRRLQRCTDTKNHKGDDKCDDERYQISLRGLKKRPLGAVKKDGKRRRLRAAHSSELPAKVDACASSRIIHGEKCMDASLNNRTAGFPESSMNWGNPDEDVHFFLGSLEHSDSDSLSSSVGSCSPYSSPYRLSDHPRTNPTQDTNIHFDDVEPSSWSRTEPREPSVPTTEGEAAEVHQLELNAYHSIIVALYAAGPLSWKREALLTNLRLMLHITNDEHLLELRHLNNYQKFPA